METVLCIRTGVTHSNLLTTWMDAILSIKGFNAIQTDVNYAMHMYMA